jgi:hypothetical protein
MGWAANCRNDLFLGADGDACRRLYRDFASVIGAALIVLSIALLWFFLPRNGQPNRLMALPFMGSAVPLLIVSAFAIGLTMLAEYVF